MELMRVINIYLETFCAILTFIMIISVIVYNKKLDKLSKYFILFAACNLIAVSSDAIAFIFDGKAGHTATIILHVSNFLVYIFNFLICLSFFYYFAQFMAYNGVNIPKRYKFSIITCVSVGIILVIISQFNNMYYHIDEFNIYHRGNFFAIGNIVGFIAELMILILIIKSRKSLSKHELIPLLSYVVLCFVAVIVQFFLYGLTVLYFATTLSVVIIYFGIQNRFAKIENDRLLETAYNELLVINKKLQPELTSGALYMIKSLCENNSATAKIAIDDYIAFAKINFDSLNDLRLVHFSHEISHLKKFMDILNLIGRDESLINMDIKYEDFKIPNYTLQPLVDHILLMTNYKNNIKIHNKFERGWINIIINSEKKLPIYEHEPANISEIRKNLNQHNFRLNISENIISITGKIT